MKAVLRIAAKELRSAVRDRQTVIYTVVLPLALYPAIFWVMLQGFTFIQGRDEVTELTVEVVGAADPALLGALEQADAPGLSIGPIAFEESALTEHEEDIRERLSAADAPDAVFVLGADGTSLYYDSTHSRAQLALERISGRLRSYAEDVRIEAVEQAGADADTLLAFDVAPRNLASLRDRGAYILSFILPMTFIIMAVMGAFYPAVDCTAGEKERGTAETTLLLPTPRVHVQLGKVLAVTVGSFVATVLNLIGLALAAEHLLSGLGDISIQIPWSSLLAAVPLCGAFLFTASAILVAIASFTETFKQGQSLLGGVQMLFIFPAVVAIMPGMQLTPLLAVVPVLQTVLVFKALLQSVGSESAVSAAEYALVFGSQLLYACLAVWLSVKLSSREALQTSGASLRKIVALWRTAGTPR